MAKRHLSVLCALSMLGLLSCNSQGSSSGSETTQNDRIALRFSAQGDGASAALVTPSDSYCVEAMENAGLGAETQSCFATPNNYNLGVLGVYLLDCQDASGGSIPCNDSGFSAVATRAALFEGEQRDLIIDSMVSSFPAVLEEVTADMNIGGIQIITAYIQQRFPDAASDATEAAKIMSSLQGHSYRICTTPHDQVDAATMETRCGHADAEMGDYLVDLDDDDTFGFLVVTDASTISETSTRPSPYSYHDTHFENREVTFLSTGDEYTTTSWFDVEGYFAPILSLGAIQSLSASDSYTFMIDFDITDSFKWTDGSDAEIAGADICVGGISDQCVAGSGDDDDSGSVGVYNPFYDTAFLPQVPSVSVTVTEVADCRDDSSCLIRLVYFGPDSSFTGGTTDSTTMYTAVSSDGVNFIEEGAIYTSSGETITDPDLFKVSSTEYVLFVSHGSEIIKATASSPTGTYTEDTSFSWFNGAVCSTVDIGGQLITYYADNSDDIGYALYDTATGTLSDQGVALANPFSSEEIGDPTVVQLSDGSYLMFYKYVRDSSRGPFGHDIYTATSSDGTTWITDTSTDLFKSSASVPGAIYLNNVLYVYYIDGTANSVNVSISADDGATYTEQAIEVFGLDATSGTLYDPNPVAYE